VRPVDAHRLARHLQLGAPLVDVEAALPSAAPAQGSPRLPPGSTHPQQHERPPRAHVAAEAGAGEDAQPAAHQRVQPRHGPVRLRLGQEVAAAVGHVDLLEGAAHGRVLLQHGARHVVAQEEGLDARLGEDAAGAPRALLGHGGQHERLLAHEAARVDEVLAPRRRAQLEAAQAVLDEEGAVGRGALAHQVVAGPEEAPHAVPRHEGGQRGRLAAARDPRHRHQAVGQQRPRQLVLGQLRHLQVPRVDLAAQVLADAVAERNGWS